MTPKEKADDLFRKMYQVRSVAPSDITKYFAKQSALVAISSEIESIMWLNLLCTFDNPMKVHFESKITELKEVEQEIEKL
jgi:hypothetical protein